MAGDWRSLDTHPQMPASLPPPEVGREQGALPYRPSHIHQEGTGDEKASIYRTMARGLKCWLGPPARPRGLSGWLRLTGPRALLSGQQGLSWGGRPLSPTEWSAVGGSRALETKRRGQILLCYSYSKYPHVNHNYCLCLLGREAPWEGPRGN